MDPDTVRVDDVSGSTEPASGKYGENMVQGVETQRCTNQIITLPLSDPEHPNNWPRSKKLMTITLAIMTVLHSTFGSSLPSNAVTFIADYFHVTNELQTELPISCFLIGYVFGPTMCGPLSEHFGRRKVMLVSFGTYILWTMSCAVAPTWGSFLFFRFVSGVSASAPIVCCGGIFADLYANPRARGRPMVIYMVACLIGPACSPPLGGFVAENTSWRWVFGVAVLFAAACFPPLLLMPETYAPTLSSRRAARLRKETGNQNIVAQSDLEEKTFAYIFTIVLARPFKMLFTEVIVSSTCAYLSLCYGVLYLYFSAYPIIFFGPDSVYKWSAGVAGLAFLPIPVGAAISAGVCLWWDSYLAAAQKQQKPWANKEEYRRLPLALIGGPCYGIAMIWLGWASRKGVFWLAPVASGIPFGFGYNLIFIAMLNYLSDAYMTFSASALAIASTTRSLFGVLLPFATRQMFRSLGIPWACSLLGILSLLMCGIPVLFVLFGEKIRANSKFCQEVHRLHQMDKEVKQGGDSMHETKV